MPDQRRCPEMDLQGIEAALQRAAQQARRIAAETNTPVVYVKDGKIVKEYVTIEQVEREEARLRKNAD